jgi:large subunit ribosomal protein L25
MRAGEQVSSATLVLKTREGCGKRWATMLRNKGEVPCIIYGDKKPPIPASIDSKTLAKYCGRHDFYSHVLEVTVGDRTLFVLPKSVQYHPVTDAPLHVDLMQISRSAEIKLHIPVEFINEEKSSALKLGALLNVVQRTVEVMCNPMKIPEQFEIDLSGAEVGRTFSIKDLKIPEGCKLPHTANKDAVLANIVHANVVSEVEEKAQEAEKAAEEVAASPAEGPTGSKKTTE